MNRNSSKFPEIIDRWFKVKMVARRPKENEEETEYSYQTGLHAEVVRRDVQESLGVGYIVSVEPIKYSQIIRELEHVELH